MDNSTNQIVLSEKAWFLLSQKDFYTTVETVTPQLATELLSRNKSNRILDKRKVTEYAESIKQGKWKLNGETIILSDKGLLRNGQHRLNAIIASNQPVTMQINAGIEDSSYKTLDQGKKRTSGDILAIEGFKHAPMIAGGLREYEAMRRGLRGSKDLRANQVLSNDGLYDLAIEKGQERLESLANVTLGYYRASRFYNPSLVFGFVLMLDELHPNSWPLFMEKVFKGVGVETHTAEYALVSNLRKDQQQITRTTPTYIKKAWFIKAFNYSLIKKKVLSIKYDTEREAYPVFIGQ